MTLYRAAVQLFRWSSFMPNAIVLTSYSTVLVVVFNDMVSVLARCSAVLELVLHVNDIASTSYSTELYTIINSIGTASYGPVFQLYWWSSCLAVSFIALALYSIVLSSCLSVLYFR